MNNLARAVSGIQPAWLSDKPSPPAAFRDSRSSFSLHGVAEFAIALVSFHHGNACHLALCAREHNLVV